MSPIPIVLAPTRNLPVPVEYRPVRIGVLRPSRCLLKCPIPGAAEVGDYFGRSLA
jgi:hypothetical protein